ncbi:hypothetical protein AMTR_s00045p00213970 [Amborella trichopoda]|uniref:Uncharacterized protein n=1 Tax=Amborella trichopoda TaxID=13333 RepID=W1P2T8_AMBTC|nr:hypothetical protein AMTR_s00045p00213970 [Amborella trichopoda]
MKKSIQSANLYLLMEYMENFRKPCKHWPIATKKLHAMDSVLPWFWIFQGIHVEEIESPDLKALVSKAHHYYGSTRDLKEGEKLFLKEFDNYLASSTKDSNSPEISDDHKRISDPGE